MQSTIYSRQACGKALGVKIAGETETETETETAQKQHLVGPDHEEEDNALVDGLHGVAKHEGAGHRDGREGDQEVAHVHAEDGRVRHHRQQVHDDARERLQGADYVIVVPQRPRKVSPLPAGLFFVSACRNVVFISKRDPENSPEYSEVLYRCGIDCCCRRKHSVAEAFGACARWNVREYAGFLGGRGLPTQTNYLCSCTLVTRTSIIRNF